MANPPSLGDLKATLVRVRESHALPNSRQGIVAKFESILGSGGVQKVVVELGQPIAVDRLVPASEGPEELPELPEDDILSAIRNGEVIEYPITSNNPFYDLFRLFGLLTKKKLAALCILVHQLDELDTWLGLEKLTHLEELFGVEVRQSPGVEPNSLLLVASNVNDLSVISTTIKLSMEKSNDAPRGKST